MKVILKMKWILFLFVGSLIACSSTTNVPVPDVITAIPGQNPGDVVVTWPPMDKELLNPYGTQSLQYNLYWSNSPGVTVETATKIPNVTSPYTHQRLTPGQVYYYKVSASLLVSKKSEQPALTEGDLSENEASSLPATASNFNQAPLPPLGGSGGSGGSAGGGGVGGYGGGGSGEVAVAGSQCLMSQLICSQTNSCSAAFSVLSVGMSTSSPALNTPLAVIFSKSFDPTSLNNFVTITDSSGNKIPLKYDFSLNPILLASPANNYNPSTTYTASFNLSGVKDMNGNFLPPAPSNSFNSFNFTTMSQPSDSTPPSIISVTPSSGTTGIGASPSILVSLTEPVTVGQMEFDLFDLNTCTFFTKSTSFSRTSSGVPNEYSVSFAPPLSLRPTTRYLAMVASVQDVTGNYMAPYYYAWSFTTSDFSSRGSAGSSGVSGGGGSSGSSGSGGLGGGGGSSGSGGSRWRNIMENSQ